MPAADLGGLHTVWRQEGEGIPALLLHCTLAHSGAWKGAARHLTGWAAPDLPGHGASEDPPEDTDLLDTCAAVIGALRDRLGAVDLVGHSYGAVVALRLALDAPERVRTLTLIEPVLFAAAEGTPEHDAYRRSHVPVATALLADRPETAARAFTAQWGDGNAWDRLPEAQRAYMTERIGLVPRQAPGIGADRSGLLDEGRLEAVTAPVLLVEGGASHPVIGAIQSVLDDRLPDSRRVTIPGAGHMAPITHPGEVGPLIAEHVA